MNAIYLISCVGQKTASAVPAKDLYISAWFLKARRFAERSGSPWFILSAQYGLVEPERVIVPYERTLNTMPVEQRREWADLVLRQMDAMIPAAGKYIFLAGKRYREFLVDALGKKGIEIDVPMEHLRIGEQLSWLDRS